MIEHLDTIDLDEGRDFMASKACYNCGETHGLNPVALDGSILDNAWACDDCMEEQARVEVEADELSAKPSCEERQRIINAAQTVQQLSNQLRAHDQTGCAECAAVHVVVCDDCGKVIAPHYATFDAVFQLRACPACAAKQARLDAIIAAHNEDMRAVA